MDTVADILPRKKHIDNRAALSRVTCCNAQPQIIEPDCILCAVNFKAFAARNSAGFNCMSYGFPATLFLTINLKFDFSSLVLISRMFPPPASYFPESARGTDSVFRRRRTGCNFPPYAAARHNAP